jgi:hypothetical protein
VKLESSLYLLKLKFGILWNFMIDDWCVNDDRSDRWVCN